MSGGKKNKSKKAYSICNTAAGKGLAAACTLLDSEKSAEACKHKEKKDLSELLRRCCLILISFSLIFTYFFPPTGPRMRWGVYALQRSPKDDFSWLIMNPPVLGTSEKNCIFDSL